MGILQRMARVVGIDASPGEAALALAEAYSGCTRRAAALRALAELAPHVSSAKALRDLADSEARQARRLRAALDALQTALPAIAAAAAQPESAHNHWARMVNDLEDHRIAVQQCRDAAIKLAEEFPSTAALFEALCQEEYAHCEILRGLVARADPQALD